MAVQILEAQQNMNRAADQKIDTLTVRSATSDKGYYAVSELQALQREGIRTVISDPIDNRRLDKLEPEERRAVLAARRSVKSKSGKELLRRRGMHIRLRPAVAFAVQLVGLGTDRTPATVHGQPRFRDPAVSCPLFFAPRHESNERTTACSTEFLAPHRRNCAAKCNRDSAPFSAADRPVRFLPAAHVLPLDRIPQSDLSANGLCLSKVWDSRARV